ncbi:MAG: hypothetical protein ABSC32_21375 [Steroidobacteraceae bacterium]|jgi:hypothetical protein
MKVDNKDTGSRMARKETSTARTGASDESIGRPANWQEGRYQQRGQPIDQSVNKPSETAAEPHDTVGTQTPPATGRNNAGAGRPPKGQAPVTQKDYE